jgi:hypothetical protein
MATATKVSRKTTVRTKRAVSPKNAVATKTPPKTHKVAPVIQLAPALTAKTELHDTQFVGMMTPTLKKAFQEKCDAEGISMNKVFNILIECWVGAGMVRARQT